MKAFPDATPGMVARDRTIAATLGLCLFAVYLLSFAGVFRTIDELALFAVTENLVQAGRLAPDLIRFARFHNPINPFEPGYSLLAAPFYAVARQVAQISNQHAVMLLSPLVTSLNGSLLYWLGRQLRYGEVASLALAFSFGLGSMAWPYSKFLLREPGVALFWTLAFLGLASFLERPGWKTAALAVVPAVMAAGIKIGSVVSFPVVFGLLAWVLYRERKVRLRWLIAASAGCLAVAAALALGWLYVRGAGLGDRIAGFLSNPFTVAGITPVYGLLFGPGKSIFVYSPILLLGVLGWPAFFKRNRELALGVALMVVVLIASLRAWFWVGGLGWGPRYMLPLFPLMLLPALELFPRRKWAWGLAGVSLAYQALVAASAWSAAYGDLFARYQNPEETVGLDWMRFAESPAFQMIWRWNRTFLDLIWLHAGRAGEMKLDLGLGLALAAAVVITGLALFFVLKDQRTRLALAASALAVGVAVPVLLSRAYWDLHDVSESADVARRLADELSHDPFGVQRVINVSPDIGMYPWLGLLKGPATSVWISPLEAAGFESLLPAGPNARLAVVVDRPHIANYPGDHLVSWLNEHAYRLESHWLEGYEIFHYALAQDPGARTPAALEWPTGIALTEFAAPASVTPGSVLPVDLHLTWLRDDWATSDALFTHLVGSDGVVISGQDGAPRYGNLAAQGWRAGQSALDRRGIWIPPDSPAGEYALIVGFANADGFVPVTLASGQTDDYATLARITIAPGP